MSVTDTPRDWCGWKVAMEPRCSLEEERKRESEQMLLFVRLGADDDREEKKSMEEIVPFRLLFGEMKTDDDHTPMAKRKLLPVLPVPLVDGGRTTSAASA